MYIYLTQNLINGKIYIGQTTKDSTDSKKYLGSGVRLQKAFRKYGKENFNKLILKDNISCRLSLGYYEIFYINLFQSTDYNIGYNIQKGGIQPNYTERKKSKFDFSEFMSNIERTKEWKNNISKALMGKKKSIEAKEKISNTRNKRKWASKISHIQIFNNKNILIYDIKSHFRNFCEENNLPVEVFMKSYRNNGIPLYLNCYEKCIKNKENLKYKGWYAIKIN